LDKKGKLGLAGETIIEKEQMAGGNVKTNNFTSIKFLI
jgi:hypothetical protein